MCQVKVPSFSIDHSTLNPGLYLREIRAISRFKSIYIWDLRFTPPTGNKSYKHQWKPLSSATMHTVEHLMAYKLRYFLGKSYIGFYPMGCRTGFTFVSTPLNIEVLAQFLVDVVDSTIPILERSEVPALNYIQCGNPKSYNLQGATTALSNYKLVLTEQFPNLVAGHIEL